MGKKLITFLVNVVVTDEAPAEAAISAALSMVKGVTTVVRQPEKEQDGGNFTILPEAPP